MIQKKVFETELDEEIRNMTNGGKTLLLAGDFNYCYLDNTLNSTKKFMTDNNF